mmetsp:Transcript_23733/g.58834  ORF Transcript_23733/g.58834 Transcript_23733/m.58834 type:complete len:268 (+) Transcript_23733:156-959(+)
MSVTSRTSSAPSAACWLSLAAAESASSSSLHSRVTSVLGDFFTCLGTAFSTTFVIGTLNMPPNHPPTFSSSAGASSTAALGDDVASGFVSPYAASRRSAPAASCAACSCAYTPRWRGTATRSATSGSIVSEATSTSMLVGDVEHSRAMPAAYICPIGLALRRRKRTSAAASYVTLVATSHWSISNSISYTAPAASCLPCLLPELIRWTSGPNIPERIISTFISSLAEARQRSVPAASVRPSAVPDSSSGMTQSRACLMVPAIAPSGS